MKLEINALNKDEVEASNIMISALRESIRKKEESKMQQVEDKPTEVKIDPPSTGLNYEDYLKRVKEKQNKPKKGLFGIKFKMGE